MLVSPDTGDDAAVYLPRGAREALVETVDFFTPIVDDPFDWGRIAAANAFSDVYAMGGRPVLGLNLVAWPNDLLPLDLLERVLEGGLAVAGEASVVVVGGHSIKDPTPKYGLAVTGFVDPARLVRNSTVGAGDRLYLTKPIGTGLVATAIKEGTATAEQARTAVEIMTSLNEGARDAMLEAGASAATDVTGFGLLGHLHIALERSGVMAEVDASAVPLLPGALDLARRDVVPGGTRSNRDFVAPHTDWGGCPAPEQLLLADAQTSGGLLVAVAGERAAALERAFARRGIAAAQIGVASTGPPGFIRVSGRPRD